MRRYLLLLVGLSCWGCAASSQTALQPVQNEMVAAEESVAASDFEGMFDLYEHNRRARIANYITEDFVLLSYSMAVNEALTEREEALMRPQLQEWVGALVDSLEGMEEGAATAANLSLLRVVEALLNGTAEVEDATAQAELDKVRAAAGISRSALMLQQVDYSQFKVRGKYARTPELGQYFQAVKYAGTIFFPVRESQATGLDAEQADALTARALMLSRLIVDTPSLYALHQAFAATVESVFGPARALGWDDYYEVGAELAGQPLAAVRTALLARARGRGLQPQIIAGAVVSSALEEGLTAADVRTGLRLLPQSFTPDSAVLQALVYDRVGEYQGNGEPWTLGYVEGKAVKTFPSALELMWLLGSEIAGKKLQQSGETNYAGYEAALGDARQVLGTSGGVLNDNLQVINYWLARGAQPDATRRLQSALGLWTYQRYTNVLYAKQSYTMVGKTFAPMDPRTNAWIAPAPELYAYLELQARKLQQALGGARLAELADVLGQCRAIALRQLRAPLGEDDVAYLNNLDKVLKDIAGGRDQPIVVDVHTEANAGLVVEQALGRPQAVTRDLGTAQARGALFNHYEFKWDMGQRLTDAEWRQMLRDEKAMAQVGAGAMP